MKEKYAIEAKQTERKFLVKNSFYIVNIVQHKWAKVFANSHFRPTQWTYLIITVKKHKSELSSCIVCNDFFF